MDNLQTRLKTKFLTICECFSNFEKVFLWLFFCLFVLLTAVGAFTHEPWFDEAQAWLIAQDLSLVEMFKHLKYEGHLCLWFLALMPSAKLNLPYPLPMLITNVIFIWGAVYVLLMKSPFHPVLRIMIAFSMPIAYQYGVIARPYAMGVMFLFLLAYFYKDKLNRPYLYATLIILCANTSAMALVGAVAFGLLFIYEYVKSNKDFWKKREFHILLGMALFCAVFIGMQLLGAGKQIEVYSYLYLKEMNPIYQFFKSLHQGLFYGAGSWGMYVFPLLFFIPAWKVFSKSPKVAFFFLFNFLSLIFIFLCAYNGYYWHHMFCFVYLILTLWLMHYEKQELVKTKSYKVLLSIFVIILVHYLMGSYKAFMLDIFSSYSNSQQFAQMLAKKEEFQNATLVFGDDTTLSALPYLRKLGVKTYNCFDGKEASFFNRKYGKPGMFNYNKLTPMYFKSFEADDTYVIFKLWRNAKFDSDYYKILSPLCVMPAKGDMSPLCIAKLKKVYKDE